MLHGLGLEFSELSTHLQGQLVAIHPAYEPAFDDFAPPEVRGKGEGPAGMGDGTTDVGARASRNLKLKAHATFSGALAWPYVYPWPQRPAGLVDEAFAELARRWKPILDVFDEHGVDLCFEIHPGEDLHDGVTFERFLAAVGDHPRANILYDPSHFVLQQLDYLEFIDFYHERIRAFHVKDAEFGPTAVPESTEGIRIGSIVPGGFALSAMGRSTSGASLASSRSMTIPDGQSWSGSAPEGC